MAGDRVLRTCDKSLPPEAHGLTPAEFIARSPRLSDFWTPLLVLGDRALRENIDFLAGWVAERGLELMPHGKTTMAPRLWHRQLDAGATGITVATPWQLRVARDSGVPDVMLANQLTDPSALRWLAQSNAPGRVWSWIDDADAIVWAEEVLRGSTERPLEVLVELGRPGGRTGVRTIDEAVQIARRVNASPVLRLAGVAGYEGALAHSRSGAEIGTVRAYVEDLVELHRRLAGLYDDGDAMVTVGGSAYPDVVGDVLAAAARTDTARYVLRSGAYLVHDDGYYRSVSPFDGAGLRPAAHGIARVVSHPEPTLALVDAGKRDFPYDEGLPVPLYGFDRRGGRIALEGAEVVKLNDQHAFVRVPEGAPLALGDLIVFGLSHPCTMFDKWRVIPVVESLDHAVSPVIVDLIETWF